MSDEWFFDDDGWFLSPVHAAAHVLLVQGGFTTPDIEAHRMVRDGGVLKERALLWFTFQWMASLYCTQEHREQIRRERWLAFDPSGHIQYTNRYAVGRGRLPTVLTLSGRLR